MTASPALIDADAFAANGCALIDGAVTGDALLAVQQALEPLLASGPGVRLAEPPAAVMALAQTGGALHRLAASTTREPLRPARVLLFDKREGANWAVGWHQDRTIAVAARQNLADYTCWTTRHGVVHVEPPFELLARMRTVRLHLDDCDADNGPLDVIPGSHALGRLCVEAVNELTDRAAATRFTARSGDALVLALPIVHRSKAAKTLKRRRVLHIDFGPEKLPGSLDWALKAIAA